MDRRRFSDVHNVDFGRDSDVEPLERSFWPGENDRRNDSRRRLFDDKFIRRNDSDTFDDIPNHRSPSRVKFAESWRGKEIVNEGEAVPPPNKVAQKLSPRGSGDQYHRGNRRENQQYPLHADESAGPQAHDRREDVYDSWPNSPNSDSADSYKFREMQGQQGHGPDSGRQSQQQRPRPRKKQPQCQQQEPEKQQRPESQQRSHSPFQPPPQQQQQKFHQSEQRRPANRDSSEQNLIDDHLEGKDLFTQCQHHLDVINACTDLQQTIKDEMKKQAGMDNIIYQKMTAKANRLHQKAEGSQYHPSTTWVKEALMELGALVTQQAHAHHVYMSTMVNQCKTIQHSLDGHHQLMKSVLSRNNELGSGNTSSPPTAQRRFSNAFRDSLLPARLAKPNRDGMSFLQASNLFEEIRKPRMKLQSKLEYLLSQQSATHQQLKGADGAIQSLLKSENKEQPSWRVQLQVKDHEIRKEYLETRRDQIESDLKYTRMEAREFDNKHNNDLQEILNVFRQHRIRYDTTLKKSFQLLRAVTLRDKGILQSAMAKEDGDVKTLSDDDESETTTSSVDDWECKVTPPSEECQMQPASHATAKTKTPVPQLDPPPAHPAPSRQPPPTPARSTNPFLTMMEEQKAHIKNTDMFPQNSESEEAKGDNESKFPDVGYKPLEDHTPRSISPANGSPTTNADVNYSRIDAFKPTTEEKSECSLEHSNARADVCVQSTNEDVQPGLQNDSHAAVKGESDIKMTVTANYMDRLEGRQSKMQTLQCNILLDRANTTPSPRSLACSRCHDIDDSSKLDRKRLHDELMMVREQTKFDRVDLLINKYAPPSRNARMRDKSYFLSKNFNNCEPASGCHVETGEDRMDFDSTQTVPTQPTCRSVRVCAVRPIPTDSDSISLENIEQTTNTGMDESTSTANEPEKMDSMSYEYLKKYEITAGQFTTPKDDQNESRAVKNCGDSSQTGPHEFHSKISAMSTKTQERGDESKTAPTRGRNDCPRDDTSKKLLDSDVNNQHSVENGNLILKEEYMNPFNQNLQQNNICSRCAHAGSNEQHNFQCIPMWNDSKPDAHPLESRWPNSNDRATEAEPVMNSRFRRARSPQKMRSRETKNVAHTCDKFDQNMIGCANGVVTVKECQVGDGPDHDETVPKVVYNTAEGGGDQQMSPSRMELSSTGERTHFVAGDENHECSELLSREMESQGTPMQNGDRFLKSSLRRNSRQDSGISGDSALYDNDQTNNFHPKKQQSQNAVDEEFNQADCCCQCQVKIWNTKTNEEKEIQWRRQESVISENNTKFKCAKKVRFDEIIQYDHITQYDDDSLSTIEETSETDHAYCSTDVVSDYNNSTRPIPVDGLGDERRDENVSSIPEYKIDSFAHEQGESQNTNQSNNNETNNHGDGVCLADREKHENNAETRCSSSMTQSMTQNAKPSPRTMYRYNSDCGETNSDSEYMITYEKLLLPKNIPSTLKLLHYSTVESNKNLDLASLEIASSHFDAGTRLSTVRENPSLKGDTCFNSQEQDNDWESTDDVSGESWNATAGSLHTVKMSGRSRFVSNTLDVKGKDSDYNCFYNLPVEDILPCGHGDVRYDKLNYSFFVNPPLRPLDCPLKIEPIKLIPRPDITSSHGAGTLFPAVRENPCLKLDTFVNNQETENDLEPIDIPSETWNAKEGLPNEIQSSSSLDDKEQESVPNCIDEKTAKMIDWNQQTSELSNKNKQDNLLVEDAFCGQGRIRFDKTFYSSVSQLLIRPLGCSLKIEPIKLNSRPLSTKSGEVEVKYPKIRERCAAFSNHKIHDERLPKVCTTLTKQSIKHQKPCMSRSLPDNRNGSKSVVVNMWGGPDTSLRRQTTFTERVAKLPTMPITSVSRKKKIICHTKRPTQSTTIRTKRANGTTLQVHKRGKSRIQSLDSSGALQNSRPPSRSHTSPVSALQYHNLRTSCPHKNLQKSTLNGPSRDSHNKRSSQVRSLNFGHPCDKGHDKQCGLADGQITSAKGKDLTRPHIKISSKRTVNLRIKRSECLEGWPIVSDEDGPQTSPENKKRSVVNSETKETRRVKCTLERSSSRSKGNKSTTASQKLQQQCGTSASAPTFKPTKKRHSSKSRSVSTMLRESLCRGSLDGNKLYSSSSAIRDQQCPANQHHEFKQLPITSKRKQDILPTAVPQESSGTALKFSNSSILGTPPPSMNESYTSVSIRQISLVSPRRPRNNGPDLAESNNHICTISPTCYSKIHLDNKHPLSTKSAPSTELPPTTPFPDNHGWPTSPRNNSTQTLTSNNNEGLNESFKNNHGRLPHLKLYKSRPTLSSGSKTQQNTDPQMHFNGSQRCGQQISITKTLDNKDYSRKTCWETNSSMLNLGTSNTGIHTDYHYGEALCLERQGDNFSFDERRQQNGSSCSIVADNKRGAPAACSSKTTVHGVTGSAIEKACISKGSGRSQPLHMANTPGKNLSKAVKPPPTQHTGNSRHNCERQGDGISHFNGENLSETFSPPCKPIASLPSSAVNQYPDRAISLEKRGSTSDRTSIFKTVEGNNVCAAAWQGINVRKTVEGESCPVKSFRKPLLQCKDSPKCTQHRLGSSSERLCLLSRQTWCDKESPSSEREEEKVKLRNQSKLEPFLNLTDVETAPEMTMEPRKPAQSQCKQYNSRSMLKSKSGLSESKHVCFAPMPPKTTEKQQDFMFTDTISPYKQRPELVPNMKMVRKSNSMLTAEATTITEDSRGSPPRVRQLYRRHWSACSSNRSMRRSSLELRPQGGI